MALVGSFPTYRYSTASRGGKNSLSVIRTILRREQEGLPLNSEAVRAASKPLHCAALRHFNSWRSVLRAAGINAARIERRREWDKAKIIARLRELCRQRRSLRYSTVHRYDSGFCHAACLTFGSWCNALVAAGINPESICRDPQWDPGKIIEAILLRAVCSEPLCSTTVRPRTLKSAAVKQFGSWLAALEASGLEPADHVGKNAISQNGVKDWLEQGASSKSHSPASCLGIAAGWQLYPAGRSHAVLCRAHTVQKLVQGVGVCRN